MMPKQIIFTVLRSCSQTALGGAFWLIFDIGNSLHISSVHLILQSRVSVFAHILYYTGLSIFLWSSLTLMCHVANVLVVFCGCFYNYVPLVSMYDLPSAFNLSQTNTTNRKCPPQICTNFQLNPPKSNSATLLNTYKPISPSSLFSGYQS